MIEYHQGYTAIKRYGRNSFRPAGKHPFKMMYNAQAVKYDLIKQIEKIDPLNANTGTVDYSFKVRKYKHGVRFKGEKEGGEISLFDEVAK